MKLTRTASIMLPMRFFSTGCILLFALSVLSGLPAYAQSKTACELLSKADAEAILGVTLQPPKPSAPFRSLLDPDFTKPVLGKPGPGASGIEQLKRALTAKAEIGDVKAQRTLGQLYQYSTLAPDGSAQPAYAGAAYWYQQASDHGDAQAAYELAILYRHGLGVAVDPSLSFQLLQKAAEAGYVPAMPVLSDLYADQKTAVSRERATDWATRAADAGDPGGWLRLGFEYNMGKLGGDPPYWYQKAMESYKKAAAGENCVAMMAIADLYAKGKGVPADTTQAQSWQAKSESCQGGNIAVVQQQVARYRARAAAGRDPALYPVLAALPNIPSSPAQAGRNNSTQTADRSGFNRSIVVGLVAAAVIVTAAALLVPNPPPGNSTDCCADQNYKAQMALQDQSRSYRVSSGGLDPNLYGC